MPVQLSAFGDEIAPALEDQLATLTELNVRRLDLRGAWGTNVLKMSDEQVQQIKRLCAGAGVTVGCLGSPIGKSPLLDPIENELNNLRRIMAIGDALDCHHIRIFSFYPPDMTTNAHYDQHIPEVIERLAALADLATNNGFTLLHENEKEIVGDTPERCEQLLAAVPALGFIWDPANFVQVGAERQVEKYWDTLGQRTTYVHIKDAKLSDGGVVPAGAGDGQVPELLTKLRDAGYNGVLALEPHLSIAGHSSGFSGVEGMRVAVNALRGVMAQVGLTEV